MATPLCTDSADEISPRVWTLPLLLISNSLDPHTLEGFTFYIMEINIQLPVLASVLFSRPAVRTAFRENPIYHALVLLLMAVVLRQAIEYL